MTRPISNTDNDSVAIDDTQNPDLNAISSDPENPDDIADHTSKMPMQQRILMEQLVLPPALRAGGTGWT